MASLLDHVLLRRGVLCCAAVITTFMWSFRWLGPHEIRLLVSSPVVMLPNMSRVSRQSHQPTDYWYTV